MIPSSPNPQLTYAAQLAAKPGPTTLYEAPSHLWMRAASLGIGLTCLGYTAYNSYAVCLYPPAGLMWWVRPAYAAVCFLVGGLGAWYVFSTARIVRAVRAVSPAHVLAAAGPIVNTTAAAASTPLLLELELGRVLPLVPARKLYVAPRDLVLPFRLATVPALGGKHAVAAALDAGAPRDAREMALALLADEERRRKAREYELNHILTAPFRHWWWLMGVAWRGIKRAFTRDGFATVEAKGQRYRMDITGGWALDNGRALDRLVSLGPTGGWT